MQESVVIKNLDHLGLVAAMVDELEIEKSVDSAIAVDKNKKILSHGVLTKAMILNGLGYVDRIQDLLFGSFYSSPEVECIDKSIYA